MNGIPVQKGAAEILNYVYQAAQNRVSDAHAVLDSVFAAAKPMKGVYANVPARPRLFAAGPIERSGRNGSNGRNGAAIAASSVFCGSACAVVLYCTYTMS